jgi:hypothetical protein
MEFLVEIIRQMTYDNRQRLACSILGFQSTLTASELEERFKELLTGPFRLALNDYLKNKILLGE